MRLSKKSTMVFAATFAALVGIACSDSTSAVPRAGITANVQTGADPSNATCNLRPELWVGVGDPTQSSLLATDGDTVSTYGLPVSITCTVRPDGDGFFVEASAQLQSTRSFTVSGHFTASGAQTGLTGSWFRGDTGTLSATDCTGSIAATGSAAIIPGAVWASISCPHAAFQGDTGRTCEATATFRFENCGEK